MGLVVPESERSRRKVGRVRLDAESSMQNGQCSTGRGGWGRWEEGAVAWGTAWAPPTSLGRPQDRPPLRLAAQGCPAAWLLAAEAGPPPRARGRPLLLLLPLPPLALLLLLLLAARQAQAALLGAAAAWPRVGAGAGTWLQAAPAPPQSAPPAAAWLPPVLLPAPVAAGPAGPAATAAAPCRPVAAAPAAAGCSAAAATRVQLQLVGRAGPPGWQTARAADGLRAANPGGRPAVPQSQQQQRHWVNQHPHCALLPQP